jgi:hypothetical protein
METYLTETTIARHYSVRVMQADGKVLASGKFPTIALAHRWIDERQKADHYVDRFRRREISFLVMISAPGGQHADIFLRNSMCVP